ncbi:MAG: hypothetical protein CL819_00845 [Croceicoccus sp.]|nr:hypothetical protein [Croceicoccus sp.]
MFDISLTFADIWPFILVGFGAQIIDGALGMAFGVLSQTMLVSLMGMPPAAASATTHLVEMFTPGASGVSHIWQRNVDWGLFRRLVPFGVLGGIGGAYLLTSIDASAAKPFVMAYLAGVGVYLFVKAVRMAKPRFEDPRMTRPLAMVGGFLDAAGGGGWGPVVTSNLLVQGGDPVKVVGTVNTAEFLLAVAISVSFIATLGLTAFGVAAVGMIIGGVIAAPFGAVLVKRVPPRVLLFAVSIVLVATSAYSALRGWGVI